MSHIPASAMPHAAATADGPDREQPPLSSAAPATGSGARAGSEADLISRGAGEPEGAATTSGQPPVNGTVTADDRPASTVPNNSRSSARDLAIALGGFAAVGGIVAAVLPMLNGRKTKGRKKKGKKKRG